MTAPRDLRLTPFHRRRRTSARSSSRPPAGSGRSGSVRTTRWCPTTRGGARDAWAALNWSPAVGAEHLAVRERVGLVDITPFAKFDVAGPDALPFLERVFANRIDRPAGSLVYTAALTPHGGIRLDLTIARKQEELFRVVTGGGSGSTIWSWLRAQLRDQSVSPSRSAPDRSSRSAYGPRARDVLGAVTEADVSNATPSRT